MGLPVHAAFIVAAYVAAILVVAMLIGWVVLDYREQRRELSALEARGGQARRVR